MKMRFLLACFLSLSPILVMGYLGDATPSAERLIVELTTYPTRFQDTRRFHGKPSAVIGWINLGCKGSGEDWEAVIKAYKNDPRVRGITITPIKALVRIKAKPEIQISGTISPPISAMIKNAFDHASKLIIWRRAYHHPTELSFISTTHQIQSY
ncbi:uncharacterized protein MELLADRAFT_111291 [Melampsora larici-populina 98AG31]|uniref:Secreted protein n=1 Tax=Melampsora larici-populina (strain 98AG31 / pathotype 3-4-7) TaxID=747676 RepID=F4S2N3_MELLP|nr:uncharacterized protein MELLADRAFT_111291 [Melampsora larici-populina 98AG31]EGG01098.1 hypothetical protein MELLADRAFT_111291 [Melampsora larici-populina 98AG31]